MGMTVKKYFCLFSESISRSPTGTKAYFWYFLLLRLLKYPSFLDEDMKSSAVCPKYNLHVTENSIYPKTLCSGDNAVEVNATVSLTIEKYLKYEIKLN